MDQQERKPHPYAGGPMMGWDKGMDNRRGDFDIPVDTLRNAINCDILTSGQVRRRRGISQIISDSGAHSLFANDVRLVWGTATTLRTCTDAFSASTLKTDARFADPFCAVDVNGDVFLSNEKINGKITAAGAYEPWGIEPPTAPPTCTSFDAAPLNRLYQVTCTFVTASGEESGAPGGVQVAGSDVGYMRLSGIPQSSDARVVATRIYVTDVDDTMFFKHVDIPAGVTEQFIAGPYGTGKALLTQFLVPPPYGQIIEYSRGRIYIAAGNLLWFTEPLRYGTVHAVHGFFMFPERITMVMSVNDGLYVSSDVTYFIDGTPIIKGNTVMFQTLTPVLPYKAIEGAACHLIDSPDVMWLSERGVVFGSNAGKVQNLTEENVAMDAAKRGAMGVVEIDGFKAAVAVMQESIDSPFVSSNYVAVEKDRIGDLRA